jgi:hypothetical protein
MMMHKIASVTGSVNDITTSNQLSSSKAIPERMGNQQIQKKRIDTDS